MIKWRGHNNFPFSVILLLIAFCIAQDSAALTPEEVIQLKETVREMFYHGYRNYMTYAFPHDELKPISKSYTDSFVELGNLGVISTPETYSGVALTLIDSLSTLAVLGDSEEFKKGVDFLIANLTFDVDARVNVFEADIRVLGGLLSAHLLALDSSLYLYPDYNGALLDKAVDIANRLLPAFNTSTGIPYAWVNLQSGVLPNETTEQCTAGIGTLLFEFEMLSYLTNNETYSDLASAAVRKLWAQRSPLNLLGNTIDVNTLTWTNANSGIGAGMDSFYETLLKVYIVFGKYEYLKMFKESYVAVLQYLKQGSWYVEANMYTGNTVWQQFNSLQAFWPGLQVLIGDFGIANETHSSFADLWRRFKVLPERYWLYQKTVHDSERYYPLRPELVESTYLLHYATRDPRYLDFGKEVIQSLNQITKVEGGYASVKDVLNLELEDRMTSFFLAETCKYLYLLFDHDNFVRRGNYVFSTEGHVFPVFGITNDKNLIGHESLFSSQCALPVEKKVTFSKCFVADKNSDYRCLSDSDCGVSNETCKVRKCSHFHYCFTP